MSILRFVLIAVVGFSLNSYCLAIEHGGGWPNNNQLQNDQNDDEAGGEIRVISEEDDSKRSSIIGRVVDYCIDHPCVTATVGTTSAVVVISAVLWIIAHLMADEVDVAELPYILPSCAQDLIRKAAVLWLGEEDGNCVARFQAGASTFKWLWKSCFGNITDLAQMTPKFAKEHCGPTVDQVLNYFAERGCNISEIMAPCSYDCLQ